jgi:hypothetical protein
MTRQRRTKKTIPDSDLVRLNSLGFSLATIGASLGCHATTVTLRLKDLGVSPADTRRTFMEDVLLKLPSSQLEWIETQLGPHCSIKEYVRSLITNAYLKHKNDSQIQKVTP